MTAIVIYFSLAVGFLVFAGQVPALPYGLILMLGFVIFLSAGMSEYWRWVRLTNAEVKKRNKLAERKVDLDYLDATERVMRQALQATPEQAKIIQSLNAVIICEVGAGDPIYKLRIGGFETKDWSPVSEFVGRSSPTHLAAVGWWTEGSEMQEFARKLTAFMVARGHALPAVGNRPAKWLDRAAGLRSIGMEE